MAEESRRDLVLLSGALLLRVLWLADLSRLPFFDLPTSDSLFYASQAARILDGHLLGSELSYPSSPLYPYMVAPFLLLGGRASYWGIYLFQSLLDALSAVLAARTASALFGRTAGWIAGGSWAAYGLAVFFTGDLVEATAAAFLANLFAYLLLVSGREGAAGLSLGAACLLRPQFLPLLAVAASLPARPGGPPIPRRAAAFLAAAALPLGLSLARNVAISGEAILVSPYGGLNAYLGNHREASGYLGFPAGKGLRNDVDLKRAAHAYPESVVGRDLGEIEVSRFWWRETLREIGADPAGWLGLMARKIRLFWSSYEAPNHLDFYFFRGSSIPLSLAALPFGIMAPLALTGALLAIRGRLTAPGGPEARGALLLALLTLGYGLIGALFFVGDRFRLPVTGWIFILASGTVAWLAAVMAGGRPQPAVLLALTAVLLGVSLFVPPPLRHGAREHVLVAASLAGRGRMAGAERFLRKAVELEPRSAVARYNLGMHLARAGRLEEASAELRRSVELAPGFSAAHAGLGDVARRLGSDDTAAHYRRALQLEPYGAEAGRLRSALASLQETGGPP